MTLLYQRLDVVERSVCPYGVVLVYTVCVTCGLFFVFFFFQAEDGIRDVAVTGVQTCALPIFVGASVAACLAAGRVARRAGGRRLPGSFPATRCDGGYSRRPGPHRESPS